jgi:hypothetical protein
LGDYQDSNAYHRTVYFSGADSFARCMDDLVDNPSALEN